MDDLFAELEEELRSAKTEMRSLKKDMKIHLSQLLPPESKSTTVQVFPGPCHAFSKAERFKEQTKLLMSTQNSSIFGQSVLSEQQEFIDAQAYEFVKVKQPQVLFSKSERFIENKEKESPALPLFPNYDFVKKSTPKPVICPEQSKITPPGIMKLLQSGVSQQQLDELETQASMSQVGPGSYSINYEWVETRRSFALPKESRFKEEIVEKQQILEPNYDAIRRKPPIAKIAKKQERTKQLIQRDLLIKAEEEAKAEYFKQRPLDIDRAIRTAAPSLKIMKSYKEIIAEAAGSKERRFLIMKLLNELKYQTLGPGAYNPTPLSSAPCTVLYRSHSAETTKLPSDDQPTPGPDYYYSKDDLIKDRAVFFRFGKEERIKKVRKQDLDMRPDLNPNIDAIKPNPIAITINPEQQTHAIVPDQDVLFEQRRGPGAYEIKTEVIDPRKDKGAVTLHPLNEKNDRVNQINLYDKEIHLYEEILYPSLEPIKPHQPAFGYYEQTDQQPQHIPDRELFPEQWKQYDYNLDAVKEKVGATVPHFGGRAGRGLIEFLRYQEHLDLFKDYLKRQDNQPEVGQYDIKFKQVDPNDHIPNFERYQQRDNEPIVKPEGDVPGDNLILNPQQPKQHVPTIDFAKITERPEGPKPREEPELDLNPNIDAIKPKIKQIVSFEKQLDRPNSPQARDVELLIEPQFTQIEKRLIGNIDFEKQVNREEDPRFLNKIDDRVLIVEPNFNVIKPKEKFVVKMEKAQDRFKNRNKSQKVSNPPTLNISRIEKAEKQILPHVPQVSMKKTSSRNLSIPKMKK